MSHSNALSASPTRTHIGGSSEPAALRLQLDLRAIPKFFVLPTFLSPSKIQAIENQLDDLGAHVTNNILEAQLILTDVTAPRRARFEIRSRGVKIDKASVGSHGSDSDNGTLGKRKRATEQSSATLGHATAQDRATPRDDGQISLEPGYLHVLKREWLSVSIEHGQIQSLAPYLLFSDKLVSTSEESRPSPMTMSSPLAPGANARSDASVGAGVSSSAIRHSTPKQSAPRRGIGPKSKFSLRRSGVSDSARHLIHETTSERDEALSRDLPEPPQWVKDNRIYACQRRTPLKSPNDGFLDLLKKIKLARILTLDEVGVRAYSTSIASIAAYPYPLIDAKEVLSLPGCDIKIALLYREYQITGTVAASKEVEEDEALKVINVFYNIWGVGAKTARIFYYEKGWRHTNDIIEQGWNSLPRNQQIGLKYYDEFEQKIPRSESEFIAAAVLRQAKQLLDDRATCAIVGGYRRGKDQSGDVDLIISHPDEYATLYLVTPLVKALEDAKLITHTLSLSETNSDRNQEPLGLKGHDSKKGGFDTLDKALVVWQDPYWSTKEADQEHDPKARNPNVHRRVDIIISPWRTVGCAVSGWTSGTTFQRDLRRFIKHSRGWKYDSSGVRDRHTGRWIDLEKWTDKKTRATTWLEAEKRVFEGLDLEWIEPEMRCTG